MAKHPNVVIQTYWDSCQVNKENIELEELADIEYAKEPIMGQWKICFSTYPGLKADGANKLKGRKESKYTRDLVDHFIVIQLKNGKILLPLDTCIWAGNTYGSSHENKCHRNMVLIIDLDLYQQLGGVIEIDEDQIEASVNTNQG